MSRRLFCLLLLLLAAVAVSQAAKRVRIPDDLRGMHAHPWNPVFLCRASHVPLETGHLNLISLSTDVTDSEEDEEWKNWGKEKRKPTQRSKMDLSDGKLVSLHSLRKFFVSFRCVTVASLVHTPT